MNWDEFKDRLNKEMPEHTSQVNADEIWNGIKQKKALKSLRRSAFYG